MYSTTRLVEIRIEPPFVVACGYKVSVYHPDGPANWVGDLWWKGTLVSNVEPRLPKSWGFLASFYPVYSCFSALVKHCTTVQVNLFHFPTSWFENALLLSAYQQFWCISFWYIVSEHLTHLYMHIYLDFVYPQRWPLWSTSCFRKGCLRQSRVCFFDPHQL